MTFILASNNQNKLKEMKKILNPLGISVKTASEYGIDLGDIEETGSTFEENAKIKAMSAYKRTSIPAIADDSGLVVDALSGQPGIYSARYSGENSNDQKNIEKLLNNMKDIPQDKRNAHFVCTICCVISEDEIITVRGECYGTISQSPKGTNGFGYDPIFITENGKTFAQLSDEEKAKISHRGNALRELSYILNKRLGGNLC